MIELEPLIFFIQLCNQQIVFELNINSKLDNLYQIFL